MDNSLTTWIIVALLVLLIGAAIFMLLRRPGGDDDSLDGRAAPAVDRDREGDRRDELGGRTAPEQTQAVAPEDRPVRDDAPFDQSSYDAGGATPVSPAEQRVVDEDRAPAEQQVVDAHPADDFLGVDAADRDEAADPTHQDPRAEGHIIADEPVDGAGFTAAPATEGYGARPADEQAYEAHPAQGEDRGHAQDEDRGYEPTTRESHDAEPLTADEVLEARGVADSDTGEGYAAAPVEPDHTDVGRDRDDHGRGDHDRDVTDAAGADGRTDQARTDHHQDTTGASVAGAGAPEAASAASASANVDEPLVDQARDEPLVDQARDEPAPGGAVFAESVYGPGSVEPAEDGSGPAGWEIKGNTGSMLFHTADSPSYEAVRAEVWFDSEESARNAGFAHWDRRRR